LYKFPVPLLAAALALGISQSFAAEPSQAQLAAQARITQAQASRTALAKVPNGEIKSVELEREHGKLVWSFDISQPAKDGVTEIQVDARSGKIVSTKLESSAEEAKEASAEAKEK
jgi:uncharacterized membrane protein YkoI